MHKKNPKCNEVQAMFSGYECKHTGMSRNRRTYRNPFSCIKFLRGINVVRSLETTYILDLYSLHDPSEAMQNTESLLLSTCWCIVGNERKYQLSAYSKNVYAGRIFPKTSNSETQAKGKNTSQE